VQDIEGSMSDGKKIQYPIIADPDRSIAKQWGAAAAAAVASLLPASSMASL
jgi:alkyl hydroperoxide reductase subunit AhpC